MIFLLGLVVGSFLNCIIYRLETRENFLKGRSYCPHCKHILSWKDLIPIFSFLFLKGKCRYCQKKISLQYPLVEFFTGFLFLAISLSKGLFSIESIFLWILASCLIIIFVFDLKHLLIPDSVIHFAIFMVLIYRWFRIWNFGNWNLFEVQNLIFAVLPSLFFLAIILISKETWMGFGDFKLSILMGLLLGWPKILIAIFFAFFLGGIGGLLLVILKKKTMKSQIPFAPFLIFGTLLSAIFGERIINLYLDLFLI